MIFGHKTTFPSNFHLTLNNFLKLFFIVEIIAMAFTFKTKKEDKEKLKKSETVTSTKNQ